jgi:hypothetical protein
MVTEHFSSTVSAIAQALAAVQAHKPQTGEYQGRMQCARCGSTLHFTILATGSSRGHCAAAGCVRWHQ